MSNVIAVFITSGGAGLGRPPGTAEYAGQGHMLQGMKMRVEHMRSGGIAEHRDVGTLAAAARGSR